MDTSKVFNEVKQSYIALEDARLKYKKSLTNAGFESEKLGNTIENKKRELEKKYKNLDWLIKEQKIQLENQNIALNTTKIDVEKARKDLEINMLSLRQVPENKKNEYEAAKIAYEQQKSEYELEKSRLDTVLQQNTDNFNLSLEVEFNRIKQQQKTIDHALQTFHNLFDISGYKYEVENKRLKTYFSTKDSINKSEGKKYFQETWAAYKTIEELMNQKSSFRSFDELMIVIEKQLVLYEALNTLSQKISV